MAESGSFWLAAACAGALLAATGAGAVPAPAPAAVLAAAESNRAERMAWWRAARFGMFVHWGLYAVHGDDWPGIPHGRYAEWLMARGVKPADYRALAARFDPPAGAPREWVRLARAAGMRYLVFTAKHHEGFAMWDSRATAYDVVDATPARRDVLRELADACRAIGLPLGLYYSVMDWDHPDYLPRRPHDDRPAGGADFDRYVDFMKAQLAELLTGYGPVATVWFDGGWEHAAPALRAAEVNALVYTLQPRTLVNDRNGLPMDYATPEQEVPKAPPARPWEACLTMNGSWGYKRIDQDWKPVEALVRTLADVVSRDGNLLLNAGPMADGAIPAPCVERLEAIGRWMAVNGEAIHGAGPSGLPAPPAWGRCTRRALPGGGYRLYLHVFDWPAYGRLRLDGVLAAPDRIWFLAAPAEDWEATAEAGGLAIPLPPVPPDPVLTVLALEFRGSGRGGSSAPATAP